MGLFELLGINPLVGYIIGGIIVFIIIYVCYAIHDRLMRED